MVGPRTATGAGALTRLPPALRPLWPTAKRLYTHGTAAASHVTGPLSRRFGGQLPTRCVQQVDELAGCEPGVLVRTVRAAETVLRHPPAAIDARNPTFEARAPIPHCVVAHLPGGRVLGRERAVVSGGGALIQEFSHYFGTATPRENPIWLTPFPGEPRQVDGALAVLASRGDGNYYHFLIDVLPRLALLEQAGADPAALRWYVPRRTRFQRELLDLLGVPAERVVDADAAPHVRAETLVVPSLPDLHLRTPPWVAAFLRSRLLPEGVRQVRGRRIYITRGTAGHTRIVRNEDELVRALTPLGFTVVDCGALSVAEQIRTFAEAETIVAPHGAGLANVAFASPGTRVVEIFPPDFVQGCYWKLATVVDGIDYAPVIGLGRARRPDRPDGAASDIVVDVHDVLCAVQRSDAQP